MDLLRDPRVAATGVSTREAQVLSAIGRRLTNAEIAAELFISIRTVESHVGALLRKLKARDRVALVDIAIDAASRAAVPRPATSFIGRTEEMQALCSLLAEHTLVTLLGPGGCGKTRLAQEVAIRWSGEVRIVDLAQLAPEGVDSALIDALDLGAGSGPNLTERARVALTGRSLLLVMDNCEHVLAAVGSAATRLVEGAPGLRVLVGSRQTLDLPAETIRALGPLPLPTGKGPEAVRASPAGQLFAERAAAGGHGFEIDESNAEAVAAVCSYLDGLPLALELAAASLRSMTIDELAAMLGQRLDLPEQAGREPRHRTMHAAVNWSWTRLDDSEAALLTRLAVLPGGLDLGEIERLEPLAMPPVTDVVVALGRLVDQSMIMARITAGSPTRYDMLETIRDFAVSRADSTETTVVRDAFSILQRDQLEEAVARSRTPNPAILEQDEDRRKVIAALRWSADRNPGVAQDLLVSIASRYELDPSTRMLDGVRDVVERYAIPYAWPSRIMSWAGLFLNYLDIDLFEECARLAAERASDDESAAFADWALGFSCAYHGEIERANIFLSRAVRHFSRVGSQFMVAHCYMARGLAATDPRVAVSEFERSMLTFLEVGASWHANSSRLALVRRAMEASVDVDKAAMLLEDGLKFASRHGLRHDIAHATLSKAQLAILKGDIEDGLSLGGQSAASFRQIGDLRCLGRSQLLVAANHPSAGEAIHLCGDALEVAMLQNDRQAQADALLTLGEVSARSGDITLAARTIGAVASVTGEPPDLGELSEDEYGAFVLEGKAGGPALVLSHI